MKVIGITGGVGAGKSEILAYLAKNCRCLVIMADDLARKLQQPGEICYDKIVELLGRGILDKEGRIDRGKMAEIIFHDAALLEQVNAIVHPAVKERILQTIEETKAEGGKDFLFIEAALLIEGGYATIVDELWYIHADEDVRRMRLRDKRGYSDEKIDSIMKGQLREEAFYKHCQTVIDNSGTLEDVHRQIERKMGENLCRKN